MNPRVFQRLMTALGAMAMVSGCDLDSKVVQSDGRTAGGSDEIDTRIAVDRTGKPVVAARIALVKTGDSSGTALAVSATGSDGAYPTFVVPDGYYSLLVRDSSGTTGRYVDSVRVVSRKLPTGRDTLLSLGSVSGVVRLLSGDSPTSVRLGLVGTDILSSAKSDGTFKIDLVPGGLYTLGAESSLDGYDRIYRRIQLKDGQNLVLPDTLVLPFTGLRVPEELDAHQDTATGNVRVSWDRVDHPDLMGYVVERVEGGVATYSRFLTDTIWMDTLGAYWERLPLLGPWPDRNVTYRVRSRSVSGAADTRSVAFQFQAKPPRWTRFVGDPTPRLIQDSTTGNVQVTWPSIRHPQLRGYVVDRIEDGGVQSGPILADTIFIDSLGAYWESLPLLGPWPERKLDYRIRLIAKEDGIEVFGDSTAMDAKPPAWTKHVDSVKVTANRDSVTGVTTLRWNVVQHPDLIGWEVEKLINGYAVCRSGQVQTSWIDSGCSGYGVRNIDSTYSSDGKHYLSKMESQAIEYRLSVKKESGQIEKIWSDEFQKSPPSFTWIDAGYYPPITFRPAGDWLIVRNEYTLSGFSKDGIAIETAPEELRNEERRNESQLHFHGYGDSLWGIKLESDSMTLKVFARVSPQNWVTRLVRLPEAYVRLVGIYSDDRGLVAVLRQYNELYDYAWRISGGGAVRDDFVGLGSRMPGYLGYSSFYYKDSWCMITSIGGEGLGDFYCGDDDLLGKIGFGSNSSSLQFVGSLGENGVIFSRQVGMAKEYAVFDGKSGSTIIQMNRPVPDRWMNVYRDELWMYGQDNHLWKGKLNLPK